MTKDASIWHLVSALARVLDAGQFTLIDHWDADLFAIGIARANQPARLVYVSTYQQPPNHYAYECEEPDPEREYVATGPADDVTFEHLVNVIRLHLSIADHSTFD